MFSGKTEELLRRIRRAQIANLPLNCSSPPPTRGTRTGVVSHDRNAMPSTVVASSQALLQHVNAGLPWPSWAWTKPNSSTTACRRLQHAGRPRDPRHRRRLGPRLRGRPFGPMPRLLALAEEVTKLHAVCVETGRAAHFSHRIAGGDNQVELGAQDRYIPLARHAYVAAREGATS